MLEVAIIPKTDILAAKVRHLLQQKYVWVLKDLSRDFDWLFLIKII